MAKLDPAGDAAVRILSRRPRRVEDVEVDRMPLGYYRAKLAAETLVRDCGLPWTILRATQFHDLVLQLVAALAKSPVLVVPRGWPHNRSTRARSRSD
ncbi:MAG: hypothetical protein ACRDRS_02250 [Pseudonocardiaceae bacterium]